MFLQSEEFFATARERYMAKLKRDAGDPWPWSADPSIRDWHLCNVHREDDYTTRWFRENIRKHVSGMKAIEATFIFRWFNRVETGEIIKDLILGEWDTQEARTRLRDVKPVVTGAYIINGELGFSKLDGVLHVIDSGLTRLPYLVDHGILAGESLEETHKIMMRLARTGKFTAYEIVSDLRWTDVLENAQDIMTWANAGPGCTRGLSRVLYGTVNDLKPTSAGQKFMLPHMQELLEQSRDGHYWPSNWPVWEMREVEHWLCEFDKIMRVRTGGRLKRRHKPRHVGTILSVPTGGNSK